MPRLALMPSTQRQLESITIDNAARKQLEEASQEPARLAALIADICLALTGSGTLQAILGHCAESIVLHLGAAFARIWTLDTQQHALELQASAGMYTHLDGPHSRVPVGQFHIGWSAQQRQPHVTNTVIDDPRVSDHAWARRESIVAFAGGSVASATFEGKIRKLGISNSMVCRLPNCQKNELRQLPPWHASASAQPWRFIEHSSYTQDSVHEPIRPPPRTSIPKRGMLPGSCHHPGSLWHRSDRCPEGDSV